MRYLHITPAFDTSVRRGRSCRYIAITFGTEKLEQWIYHTVKKFENMFTHFARIHQCDRQTDGHHTRHIPHLCI